MMLYLYLIVWASEQDRGQRLRGILEVCVFGKMCRFRILEWGWAGEEANAEGFWERAELSCAQYLHSTASTAAFAIIIIVPSRPRARHKWWWGETIRKTCTKWERHTWSYNISHLSPPQWLVFSLRQTRQHSHDGVIMYICRKWVKVV